jgi:hypothetical protein
MWRPNSFQWGSGGTLASVDRLQLLELEASHLASVDRLQLLELEASHLASVDRLQLLELAASQLTPLNVGSVTPKTLAPM